MNASNQMSLIALAMKLGCKTAAQFSIFVKTGKISTILFLNKDIKLSDEDKALLYDSVKEEMFQMAENLGLTQKYVKPTSTYVEEKLPF